MKILKIGDVVSNSMSGCSFVVEEEDVDIVNSSSNEGNYIYYHNKFRKLPTQIGRYKVGEFIEEKVNFLGFIPITKRFRIMRDPNNGRIALTSKTPWCLYCNKVDRYIN